MVSPLPATSAVAINNHGVVAGYTYEVSPGHFIEAVTWSAAGTTAVVLPAVGGANLRSSAYGINDRGVIVGYSQSGAGAPTNYPFHATLWGPGATAPTDLGALPGGEYSRANGVNAAGVVVGVSATGTSGEQDAVLWRRGKNGWRIVPLPQLPGGNSSEATAVNDDGDVVGEASTADGQGVAVRWKK
jgi:probable HAF family extracellular repeat protein